MTGFSNSVKQIFGTGSDFVDGILTDVAWADATIFYAFSVSGDAYNYTTHADLVTHFNTMTQKMKDAADAVLSADDGPAASAGFSFEGLTLQNVESRGDQNSQFAEIRFAESSSDMVPTARVADFPDNSISPFDSNDNGDVWFGTRENYRDAEAGNFGWVNFYHEVGHALGLAHGHTQDGKTQLPAEFDSVEYSVMTYRSHVDHPGDFYTNEQWGHAQSFMMADIAALQHVYGADFTTNGGNTVYKWSPNSGDTLVNGAVGIAPGANRVFATIWDGNGNDTYDLSDYETDLILDLRPGASSVFSDTQLAILNTNDNTKARGNIFNALQHQGDLRSLIENALGGSGDDWLIGNQVGNKLVGNFGDDTLQSAEGSDTIFAGNGADTAFGESGADDLFGGAGFDTLYGGLGNDTLVGSAGDDRLFGQDGNDDLTGGNNNDLAVGAAGRDTITGGKGEDTLKGGNGNDSLNGGGGDDTITAGKGTDILIGGRGTDDMTGGAGADELRGQKGNDILSGGAGADRLEGGRGNDTLAGGTGADVFIYNGNANEGIDRIADFANGTDKIEIYGSTTFGDLSITRVGANTQVTWDNTKIIIEGVTNGIGANDFDFV